MTNNFIFAKFIHILIHIHFQFNANVRGYADAQASSSKSKSYCLCDFVTDLNSSLPFFSLLPSSIETERKSSDCNQLNCVHDLTALTYSYNQRMKQTNKKIRQRIYAFGREWDETECVWILIDVVAKGIVIGLGMNVLWTL